MSDTQHCARVLHMPSYNEFCSSYLKPNIPVIIGPALAASWPAFQHWVVSNDSGTASSSRNGDTADSGGTIDWDYLSEHYGHHEVTVADCSNVDSFGNQDRDSKPFRDVVSLWMKGEGQSLYVKDWHLAKAVEHADPNNAFYTTPNIFHDDWMNAYYSAHTDDDFRFVYVGAKGTFTPLHRDVYTSYSWSTNICGWKRWWLFPPDQTRYLFMKYRNLAAYDARNVDPVKFPDFHNVRPIVIEQRDGETLFVPSGWYHQVENLTACISINHNWCNSVNLPSLYKSMCDKVVEVERALDDVHDMLSLGKTDDSWKLEWVSIVQDVVRVDAGWNWLVFWKMVLHALQAVSTLPTQPNCSNLKSNLPTPAPLFQLAPASLRPPTDFIQNHVQDCYDNFVKRDQYEGEGDVAGVVLLVKDILDRLPAQGHHEQQ